MEGQNYICINGDFRKSSEPCLSSSNRVIRYGDVLHEHIHACATEAQFLDFHLQRLADSMQLLQMEVPISMSEPVLRKLITQLLNKNRIFGGAHIILTVFRVSGYNRVPEKHNTSFIIESIPLAVAQYVLNEKGLTVGISKQYTKSFGPLSVLHDHCALLYMLAGMESHKDRIDAYILLNESGYMVETHNSNIFFVSGDSVFTPGVQQGCIPGIMQRVVSDLVVELGMRMNESSRLTPAVLDDAEEVFCTNAVEGIRWVGAYRDRRYYKGLARKLTEKLNERAFR
jgi:branched-chain amino acid aminotransferase